MWRRRDYTYGSADSHSDLDHPVSYEPELFVYRGNATTIRYSQRPKRRDDERCEHLVGYIRCFCGKGVCYRVGHLGSRWHGHNHCDFWIGECNCIGDGFRNTSDSMLIDKIDLCGTNRDRERPLLSRIQYALAD